jgi:hypothetical protein
MANTPNPIKSQVTLYIVGGIVVIAVASIVYLAIARPILQKIGIIDDKKDKERDNAIKEGDKSQWFTSIPYKANKSQITISETKANVLATEIYNAKNWYYDCETCAVGSIIDAGTKINVSYVAYRFYMLYNRDLMSYLKSFLETNDWVTLYDTYKKLPAENKKSMVVDEIIIVKE